MTKVLSTPPTTIFYNGRSSKSVVMGSVLETGQFNVKKIAVIGAGPSGLAVAKYLLAEKAFDKIDIYEQQSEVGGVWNYNPNIAGEVAVPQTTPHVPPEQAIWTKGAIAPLFSNPMYDHLNTNIPKDLMQFSDQEFHSQSLLFPTRQDVQDYLVDYSKDVRHLIIFSAQVQDVRLSRESGQERWELLFKSTITNDETRNMYDAVVVASGHYTVPFIPSVKGIEQFHAAYPSIISHSKTYRTSDPFTNKKVIVVGNAASGLDIGTQIGTVCKKPLLNSVRTSTQLGFGQENREEVPAISEYLVKEKGVRFENGRIENDIDAIVYCTGYLYSFPFLESLKKPIVTTGRRVMGLYKTLFNIDHPTLAFAAIQKRIIPFPLAEAQGAVFGRVWSNRLVLPASDKLRLLEESDDLSEDTNYHVLGYPKDGEYINNLHDWAISAEAGPGKEPPFWGEQKWWMRQLYVDIRKKFIETGGSAKSLDELGFVFEKMVT